MLLRACAAGGFCLRASTRESQLRAPEDHPSAQSCIRVAHKNTPGRHPNRSAPLPPGPAAKRLRQEQQLDGAVTRLLHLLGAAAGRLLPGGPPLSSCSVGQLVGAAGRLGPEARRALEEDLTMYCHLCTALR